VTVVSALAVSAAVFAVSLFVLLVASQAFVDAAERLGLAAGVSPYVVGGTVVAGGTSLPELVASVFAVQAGATPIVVGSAVGANVVRILLVLGVAAVAAGPLRVDRELMRVDLPLLAASAGFLWLTAADGRFGLVEGLLGLVGLAVYTHWTVTADRRLTTVVEELVAEHADADAAPAEAAEAVTVGPRTYLTVLVSLVAVLVSADRLVVSLLSVADLAGFAPAFVALTAVAVGTSLPELTVAVLAANRGSADVAVGTILGSNVFTAFAVMGVPSLFGPLSVPASVRAFSLPVMLFATLLYFFVTQDREITPWDGAALLVLYAAYLANLLPAPG
jgi:cation:H+ antiporter